MTELPQEREFGAVFPNREYDERRRKVREAMAQRDIDLLYVTSPKNINYLTGFDIIWFYNASPSGLVVRADSDDVLFFDSYHDRMVSEFSYVTEAVFYATFPFRPLGNALDTVVNTLGDRGLLKGTIALEKWAHGLSPVMLAAMEERMTSAGARVVDGSWVVDRVALVKSPLEIACMRKAAEIADIGIEAGCKALRPGITEIEIMAEINYAMGKAGGEEAAIRTNVSGQGLRMSHKPATRHKVNEGEQVFVDICGVFNRYHANLCRFYSLGEPSREAREMMDKLADSLPVVIATVKPGDPTVRVGEVMDEYIDSVGLKGIAQRGGYSLGIAIPPDWVGHTRIVPGGFEEADFVPGTIMNYEIFAKGSKDRSVGFIDTLLMTDAGLEALSNVPRELMVGVTGPNQV